MPELPEVEIIVRGLRKNILGLKLTEFKILNKNLRYEIPKEMEVIYKNKIIKHIFRIGKYGILLFNGQCIYSTGNFFWCSIYGCTNLYWKCTKLYG